MTTASEEPYAIVVGPHLGADGHPVYALACEHATVSTIDVEHRFSPDYALGLFVLLHEQDPIATPDEVGAVAMRLLLGWTLAERTDCSCYERPFRVTVSDGGVLIEDLG